MVRVLVVVAIGLLGCTRPRPAPAIADAPPPPEPARRTGPEPPLAVWFGTWSDDSDRFERKTRFAKVEGETFGWRIKTRCTSPVRFREVMRLPAPGDWSFTPDEMPGTTISEDRTTTTTIGYAACRQGWVEHVWTVAAGDPAGTYVITVELEGYARQTFRPKFVEP